MFTLSSCKKHLEQLILKQGIELKIHRIAKTPYQGKKIAYIHIAKSGGISVDLALRSQLAAVNQPRIDRQATLSSSMASFGKDVNSIESACDFSEHHAKQLQGILNYYLNLQWQYVSGHVTVTQTLLARHAKNYAFITILRDPVKRFISNYIFNKLTNTQTLMPPCKNTTDDIITEAKTIISSRRGWHIANIPTMCLTGRFPVNPQDAKSMQSEVANNLSQFHIVGFLDELSNFEHSISRLTGRNITIAHHNTSKEIQSDSSNHIKDTLMNFFQEQATQIALAKLCEFETGNYLKAKELYKR